MNKLYFIFLLLLPLISSAQSSDYELSQDDKDLNPISISNDFSTDQDVKIYPNPSTNGFITIRTSNIRFFKSVSIYDVLGKEVLRAHNISAPIDISSLKSGVYILNINEIGKTFTRKLIIK